jgi:hypothetical protein
MAFAYGVSRILPSILVTGICLARADASCAPPEDDGECVSGCSLSNGIYDLDGTFFIGVSIGWGVAIMCIVLGSLPVCCGVKKESKHLRMIGTVIGMVACVCYFIPIISYKVSEEIDYDELSCERCCDGCCEVVSTERVSHGGLDAIPMIIVFMPITIVLASVAVVLACCICDPCCGPLKHFKHQERVRSSQSLEAAVVGVPTTVGAKP